MSKFQVIFTAIFAFFIVVGVIVFATYKSKTESSALPAITIWGSYPSSIFNQFISKMNQTRSEPLKVSYVEIDENGFDKTFIESLARGQGPDVILIPQSMIYRHEDKLIPIPYTTLTVRDFKNTFIEQAELYLHPTAGVMALPFSIDPLVMYWNRDTFTNAGIATFPRFWNEFGPIGQKINQKDSNLNIRKSLIAMGEFTNVSHAREVLGVLMLQSGNPVTLRDDGGLLNSAIGNGSFNGLDSTLPALDFFTKYSDPRSAEYSWNRSLPSSKTAFLAGNLATYIGLASELFDIRQKNPNLDFDVAPLPQAPGGTNRTTYGSMYGLSIVKTTANVNGTYEVLTQMLTPEALNELVGISYLPPVRRDMIATGSTDPYLSIFYDGALISKSWLDINKQESYMIFQNMVEDVTSGRRSERDAIENANDQYDISLKNI